MRPRVSRRASLLGGGLAVVASLVAATVRAEPQDRAACVDAYGAAQDARKAGKLLVARGKLEVCTDASCPGMIQRDCARWLEEVTRALPSVIVVARDSAGHDLVDATVAVDGAPVRLDGRALSLDPGKHVVRVRTQAGERREETLLLVEGEHDRSVAIVFPADAPPLPTVTAEPQPVPTSRPVPTASWVLGGLGVASIGVFGIFAWRGASDRASLGCDHGCASGSYASVDRQFLVADVALGAGIALVGAAIVWWLVDRSPPAPRSGAAPGPRGGAL